MIPSAELRLFEPLHAFPAAERERWERWLVAGGHLGPTRHRDLPTAPGVGFLVAAGDGARVLVADGTTYLSPDRAGHQVLDAILTAREEPPFGRPFVPAAQARRARRELRRLRRRHPGIAPAAIASAWQVPARWFTLFDDEERSLETSPGLSLTYRTTARKALGRLERAIPILRGADLAPAAEPLFDLYRWIANAHPRALVRLDYGGLCDLLRWDELDDDHGARDLAAALDALAMGEGARSAELYGAVAGRHADLRGRTALN
mgnify:CR=1 FL=1